MIVDNTSRKNLLFKFVLSFHGFKYMTHMQQARDDFGYNAGDLANGGPQSRNKLVAQSERVQEWSTVFAVCALQVH
jgi:hypothetical protein